MALRLITAPTALAVSLADAKVHLRVDGTDEDALITSMITAATEAAEQAIGRAIMPQTWEVAFDAFPSAIELTRTPVTSIVSVIYADADGVQTTMPGTDYALGMADEFGFGFVVPAYAGTWPTTRAEINAVKVQYVAGYAVVPESIKSWIKLQVGAMFANREAEGSRQSYALGFVDVLINRYKVYA